ncbi:shikimate kinase AroK [Gordonia defluvii]|jgi:shikimate kinase|uniref:Shikimate kinase n=1 Tax=Gordonia defluvii TaxID=283718 RepID=A0ABP6LJY2_9ACTN|nr:shikimate kinase [Gordonia sp. UBA5067]
MSTAVPAVVLTGFMGAGKSAVGHAVAARLGVGFLDTDSEVERTTGRSVAEIFATDGEAAFRQLEFATVARVLREFDGVVALGGGSVTVPGIRAALDGHQVVYLRVSPEVGFARVMGSARPLLAGDDPRGTYVRLLAQRCKGYDSAATATVDADQPLAGVVAAVLAAVDADTRARKDNPA